MTEEAFNAYAESGGDHDRGLLVHRFSKQELPDYLAPHFDICLWRQVSCYRAQSIRHFENRLKLPSGKLNKVGNSQFAVVRKKA